MQDLIANIESARAEVEAAKKNLSEARNRETDALNALIQAQKALEEWYTKFRADHSENGAYWERGSNS